MYEWINIENCTFNVLKKSFVVALLYVCISNKISFVNKSTSISSKHSHKKHNPIALVLRTKCESVQQFVSNKTIHYFGQTTALTHIECITFLIWFAEPSKSS